VHNGADRCDASSLFFNLLQTCLLFNTKYKSKAKNKIFKNKHLLIEDEGRFKKNPKELCNLMQES
jgi:hypothetical protein